MSDSDDEDGDDGAPVKNLVASCTELKVGGNEHFKAGRCDEAVTEYQKAVDKLTSAPAKKALAEFFKASPDSPDTASPLLASLHGNMAASHVKASLPGSQNSPSSTYYPPPTTHHPPPTTCPLPPNQGVTVGERDPCGE